MRTFILILFSFFAAPSFAQQKEAARNNFTATLTVKAITVKTTFSIDGKIEAKEEMEQQYTVKQGLRFYSDLLKRLDAKTQKIDFCSSESMCVLLNGTSQALGVNQPVVYSTRSTSWGMCNDRLIVNGHTEGGGTIADYNVSSMVSVIRRTKDDLPEAVPLVKNRDVLEGVDAAPLANPDYYIRLFVNIGGITPNINPAAPKLSGRFYDCSTKKWTEMEPSKYGLSIPDFSVLGRNLKSGTSEVGTNIYRSPIFNDKELLSYLRKPSGGKMFSFEVKDYFKSEAEEVSTTIWVSLELR